MLYEQANEGGQLKATLNAMKESELELAEQEAADNARHVELLVGGQVLCIWEDRVWRWDYVSDMVVRSAAGAYLPALALLTHHPHGPYSQADENDQLQLDLQSLQSQLVAMRQQLLVVKATQEIEHTPLSSLRNRYTPKEPSQPVASDAMRLSFDSVYGSESGCTPLSPLMMHCDPITGSESGSGSRCIPMSPLLMCMTPPECLAMLEAVEDAIQNATSALTPGRGPGTPGKKMMHARFEGSLMWGVVISPGLRWMQ